jgi:hypothetical protein
MGAVGFAAYGAFFLGFIWLFHSFVLTLQRK